MSSRFNIFERRASRNAIALMVLVFQAVFLNIVVPGHTRGAMTMAGRSLMRLPCCDQNNTKDQKGTPTPTPTDRANCAICSVAAHFTPPPVVNFELPKMGLLEIVPAPVEQAFQPILFVATYDACGPPVISYL